MTEQTIVSLIAAVGAVGVAALGSFGVVLGLLWKRITRLEVAERRTWLWARIIVDMYYRWRKDDAPDLPPPPKFEGENP